MILVDIASGHMATDNAIPDDPTPLSMRHAPPPALLAHVGGLTPEQCGVLAALCDGARMWRECTTSGVRREAMCLEWQLER